MDKHIQYAVTLTTGDQYNLLTCRKHVRKLNELLLKYREYFMKFIFTLEILDKNLIETKIYFHGYVKIQILYIQQFQEFIHKWNKINFTKVKIITDLNKWIDYITKHQDILKVGYPDIRQVLLDNDTLLKSHNLLKRWKTT